MEEDASDHKTPSIISDISSLMVSIVVEEGGKKGIKSKCASYDVWLMRWLYASLNSEFPTLADANVLNESVGNMVERERNI